MARLEALGKILTAGFGDRVLIGVFMGLLDQSTPEGCYEWIRDNHPLLDGVSDGDWAKYRKLAGNITIDLSRKNIVKELRKHRPDLLGVLLNHPGGLDWLDNQIAEVKKKLGWE